QYLHESPITMTIPLWALGGLSIVGGFLGIPGFLGGSDSNLLQGWLSGVTADHGLLLAHSTEWVLMFVSIAIAVGGFYLAYQKYYSGVIVNSDASMVQRHGDIDNVWKVWYHID